MLVRSVKQVSFAPEMEWLSVLEMPNATVLTRAVTVSCVAQLRRSWPGMLQLPKHAQKPRPTLPLVLPLVLVLVLQVLVLAQRIPRRYKLRRTPLRRPQGYCPSWDNGPALKSFVFERPVW